MDECREAILELSVREDTFFGPFEMPLLNVQLEKTEEIEEEGIEEEDGEENPDGDEIDLVNDDDDDDDNPVGEEDRTIEKEESNPRTHHMEPSEESREKLAKLEPLPPLLEDFDLDAHVGLIQRVLKEDPQLVQMQATLSGT